MFENIRKNEQRHFASGKANSKELISNLVHEGLQEGCSEVRVVQSECCWYVFFDLDWISKIGSNRYFESAIKFDTGIAGGIRAGVLIGAFSTEYWFYDKSAMLNLSIINNQEKEKHSCCIAFRDI